MEILEVEINKSFEIKKQKKRGPKRKYTEPRRSLHIVLPEQVLDVYDEMAYKCGCTRTEMIHTALLQVDKELAENTQKTFQMMRNSIDIYKNQAQNFQSQTEELNQILKRLSGDVFGFLEVIPEIEGLDKFISVYENRYRKLAKEKKISSEVRKIYVGLIYSDLESKYIKEGNYFKNAASKAIEKAIIKKLMKIEANEENLPEEG